MDPKNILITGPPRSGKSTLIEKLVGQIKSPLTGFFTREIREEEKRVGFSVVTLDGKEGTLARLGKKSRFKVGNYGVDLEILDRIAVPSMIPSNPDDIVIIDEIGKMECLSPLFRKTLIETLDSPNRVIGSIGLRGDAFMEKIKKRKDLLLVSVSADNRDILAQQLIEQIGGSA